MKINSEKVRITLNSNQLKEQANLKRKDFYDGLNMRQCKSAYALMLGVSAFNFLQYYTVKWLGNEYSNSQGDCEQESTERTRTPLKKMFLWGFEMGQDAKVIMHLDAWGEFAFDFPRNSTIKIFEYYYSNSQGDCEQESIERMSKPIKKKNDECLKMGNGANARNALCF